MNSVLTSHNFNLDIKTRRLKCYVFLLYGDESWTLTGVETKKLKAFALRLYKRIMRIFRKWKIKNATLKLKVEIKSATLNEQ